MNTRNHFLQPYTALDTLPLHKLLLILGKVLLGDLWVITMVEVIMFINWRIIPLHSNSQNFAQILPTYIVIPTIVLDLITLKKRDISYS